MQFITLGSIILALSVCGASAAPAYSQSDDCETSLAPSTTAAPITFATTILLNAPSGTASATSVDNDNAFKTTIFLNKPSATASAPSVDQSGSDNATPAIRPTIFLNGPFATATPLSSILQYNRRQIASALMDPINFSFSFGGIVPTSSTDAYGPVQTSSNSSSLPASSALATGTGLVAPIASTLSVLQPTNALSTASPSASAPAASNASSMSISTLVVIGTVTAPAVTITEPAVTVTVTVNCSANATSVAAATGVPSAGAATSALSASASSQPSSTGSATSPTVTVAPASFSIFLTLHPSPSSSVASSA